MSIAETHDVAGMTCDHCARAVRTEVSALDGVTDVDVDLDRTRSRRPVTRWSDAVFPGRDPFARAPVA